MTIWITRGLKSQPGVELGALQDGAGTLQMEWWIPPSNEGAYQPPTAEFTADPVLGYAPLRVEFIDQSTGNPTSWFWDFYDDGGCTSTAQNPVFTFDDPGVYSVRLRVENPGGSDDLVRYEYVTVLEKLNCDVTYEFGETSFPEFMVTGPALSARNRFVRRMLGIATLTFEDFQLGQVPPYTRTLDNGLWDSSVNLTITSPPAPGTKITSFELDENGAGRFGTTEYWENGGKYFQCVNEFTVEFSRPIGSMGFYGTDFGDFEGQVSVAMTYVSGEVEVVDIPHLVPADNANLIFWGFMGPCERVTKVRVYCSSGNDYFGIDDIIVGQYSNSTWDPS